MKSVLFRGSVILVAGIAAITLMSYVSSPNVEIGKKRTDLMMRNIGHELLLASGDSTSRVLPVRKLTEQTYLVEFENSFGFDPDNLKVIAERNLAEAELSQNYIVEVLDKHTLLTIYGYESGPNSKTLNACAGRSQPIGDYAIQITFTEPVSDSSTNKLAIVLVIAIGVVALVWPRGSKKKSESDEQQPAMVAETTAPEFRFDEITGFVTFGSKQIELTSKESKLLKILVANINQMVDRNDLHDAVWQSEGVITSRSLDMFISKLRKKLEPCEGVKIVNIHGQGYRLEHQLQP